MDADHGKILRRGLIKTSALGAATALAGCSQVTIGGKGARVKKQPSTASPNLNSAKFSFKYNTSRDRIEIKYKGGGHLKGDNIQIQSASSTGKRTSWAQLGSTTAGPQSQIQPGETAILGKKILNWGQPVKANETIRVVYTGQQTPTTLGRFTPPQNSTLTSTVPPTSTTKRTTTTTTSEPTTTTTTSPTIRAFSISNPSQYKIRVSFNSSQHLSNIAVHLSGDIDTTLDMSDFTDHTTTNGNYEYTATDTVSSAGNVTATLERAVSQNGINGATGTKKTVSIQPSNNSSPTTIFVDKFNSSGFQNNWRYQNDKQKNGTTVNVGNGDLFDQAPFQYGPNHGTLVTKNTFKSTGVVKISVKMKTLIKNYWGYGFGLQFPNNGITLKEHKWENFNVFGAFGVTDRPPKYSVDYTYYGKQKHTAKFTQATSKTSFLNYSMTIDLDGEKVLRVKRGDSVYHPKLDVGKIGGPFRLKVGCGGGHKFEVDTIYVTHQ